MNPIHSLVWGGSAQLGEATFVEHCQPEAPPLARSRDGAFVAPASCRQSVFRESPDASGWRSRRCLARTAALKAEQHGLGLQLDFPLLQNPRLDFILQLDDFGGGGASAVDDGKRMLV